jgi:hypothetical protein
MQHQTGEERAWMLEHLQRELGALLGGQLYGQLDHLAAGLQDIKADLGKQHQDVKEIQTQLDKNHKEITALLLDRRSSNSRSLPSAWGSFSCGSPADLWALSDQQVLQMADKDSSNSISPNELSLFLQGFGLPVGDILATKLLRVHGKLSKAAEVARMKKLLQHCWEAVQAVQAQGSSMGSGGEEGGEEQGAEAPLALSKEQGRRVMLQKAGKDEVEEVLEDVEDGEQINFPRLTWLLLEAKEK